MIFASVCISEEETITTTAPPVDAFFLSMMVDGADYQDVGLGEIKAMPYEQVDSTWGGTSFYGFMESIGVTNIVDVAVAASDGYSKTVNYADLADAILAWEDETGAEISEEDGGPIRFIAPSLPKNAWTQNLAEIRVTTG